MNTGALVLAPWAEASCPPGGHVRKPSPKATDSDPSSGRERSRSRERSPCLPSRGTASSYGPAPAAQAPNRQADPGINTVRKLQLGPKPQHCRTCGELRRGHICIAKAEASAAVVAIQLASVAMPPDHGAMPQLAPPRPPPGCFSRHDEGYPQPRAHPHSDRHGRVSFSSGSNKQQAAHWQR